MSLSNAHHAPANRYARLHAVNSESASPVGKVRFGGDYLLDRLAELPTPDRYWIGFSGGPDSTALLQAMHDSRAALPAAFCAVHFHHGLQAGADAWQAHCRDFCAQRSIAFHSERLDVGPAGGASPEEAARNARYRAIAGLVDANDMYLTAHHAEDLAETLFLNLMRGSGIEGLAGIPELRKLERGWVARPLLEVCRAELLAFLEARKVAWLTDPSNADTRFDRNFLRHELFPLLEQRWPGLLARLTRVARHARVSAGAVAAYVEHQSGELLRDALKMPLHPLLGLEPTMQSLVVREWLRRHEIPPLPEVRLLEFLDQLAQAGPKSQAEVSWEGWLIKHYRSTLWLHRREPFPPCPRIEWRRGKHLQLGPESGALELRGRATGPPDGWRVRGRRPGDRIRPQTGAANHRIKQLFQSAAIPPWLRAAVPVLTWDGEPVALGDWVLAPRLQDWLAQHRLEYRWNPTDPVLDRIRQDCHH